MAFPVPSLTASGISFATWQQDGPTGHLKALIAANLSATAAPTAAPTLAATADTGSTLPTATYYVKITETNAFGETTPSPLSTGQAITSGTNHLTVTFPSLKTGNTARNVYVGVASDGSDLKLAVSGVTASTAAISAPLPTNSYAVKPPTVSSTGLTFVDANGNTITDSQELSQDVINGNLQYVFKYLQDAIGNFNSGKPMPFNSAIQKLRHAHGALLLLTTMCAESGTLMDANAGTIVNASTGIGGSKQVRTWP